ncbi:MAG: zinc-binding dehydrogenase [Nitrososphaera sp.]|jgi:NADPH:quinone reductase-like Zn-dependent oxidoreductase
MKAAVFREIGREPSKLLKIEDIETPKIKPNEVLVRIESTAYNYDDLWALYGYPIKVPMPHISGSDAAGTVMEVGEDVTKFQTGDRVVIHPNLSCRVCNACNSGREYDCDDRLVWGYQTGPLWGGFSQYTHMPDTNLVKIPDNLSFKEAAAIAMVGMTSWHMLVGRAKIQPRQTVLVMGGASGIGMAAIQIAKIFNCTVIATAGNKEKIEKCYSLGADFVVNHRSEYWDRKVREITNRSGIDVVIEHIGKTHFPIEIRLLRKGGTLVSTGATTGYDSTIDLRYLFFKGINILGSTQGTKAELEEVVYWTSKGKIKPLIDTILPFGHVAKGFEMMKTGDHFGKILLTPQKI